jgi:transposase
MLVARARVVDALFVGQLPLFYPPAIAASHLSDDGTLELDRWLAWASRSRLKPFVNVARTIRKKKDGVLAYVTTKLTNGLVEGFNNKLRMIARRAFGFHSADALIGMLFLCCGGVTTSPPLPGPWCTW